MDWFDLAQDFDEWLDVLNTITNLKEFHNTREISGIAEKVLVYQKKKKDSTPWVWLFIYLFQSACVAQIVNNAVFVYKICRVAMNDLQLLKIFSSSD